tara:strand:+ start:383 stop:553 length:171 start_codon:yes stop_codon:yes gene_type:complete
MRDTWLKLRNRVADVYMEMDLYMVRPAEDAFAYSSWGMTLWNCVTIIDRKLKEQER